jgi:hypothetical protein
MPAKRLPKVGTSYLSFEQGGTESGGENGVSKFSPTRGCLR